MNKYAPLFFEAFKDKYYEKKAASLKKIKADEFYTEKLTFNVLLRLH